MQVEGVGSSWLSCRVLIPYGSASANSQGMAVRR